MGKRRKITNILIITGLGLILMAIALPGEPKELPWNKPKNLVSNSPSDPQFEMAYDYDLGQEVMRLYGEGAKYYFHLTGSGGGSLITKEDKEYTSILGICMKSHEGEYFQMNIFLQTEDSQGGINNRTLVCVPHNQDRGHYAWGYIYNGIGIETQDGGWHEVWIDIRKDINRHFPLEELVRIKSISFYGNLSICKLCVYTEFPPGKEATKPEVIEAKFVNFYDESKRKIGVIYTQYNLDGTVSCWSEWKYLYKNEEKSPYTKIVYSYTAEDELKYIYIYEYGKRWTRTKEYGSDMVLQNMGIYKMNWDKEEKRWVYNSFIFYFDKEGDVWFYYEDKDDTYRGYESGSCTYIFGSPKFNKNLEGQNIKEALEDADKEGSSYEEVREEIFCEFGITLEGEIKNEYTHGKQGIVESRHTVFDGAGSILSEERRQHNPELIGSWWYWGVWTEKWHYHELGKLLERTRCRNLSGERLGGGLFSRVEHDDSDREIRMKYYLYDRGDLKEIRTYYYNQDGDFQRLEKDRFEPWNLSWYLFDFFPGIAKPSVETLYPSNLVVDGDMKEEGVKPWWIKDKGMIAKKTRMEVEGKRRNVLRVEKPYEEEAKEEGPKFLSQFIPIGGGEYRLKVNYIRKCGTAWIELSWVAIEDIFTLYPLDDLATPLEKFKDDFSLGPQEKEFIFSLPSEPGVLILKIGAASVIIYTNIELVPYTTGPPAECSQKPSEEPVAHSEDYTPEVVDIPTTLDGGKEYTPGQKYNETPANETPANETPADETPANETPADETPATGGFVVIKEKDGEKTIEEKYIVQISPRQPHIRTTVGREIRKGVIEKTLKKQDIPVEENERPIIASEGGTGPSGELRYGREVEGPGPKKELYTVDPKTTLPQKEIPTRIVKRQLTLMDIFKDIIRKIKDLVKYCIYLHKYAYSCNKANIFNTK